MHMSISNMLGVEMKRVHIDFAGLNHLVYGMHVFVDDQEVTDKVLEMLGNPKIQMTMKNIAPLAWNRRFLKSLGVVPCPYHRYYYKTKTILEEELEDSKQGKLELKS